MFVTGAGSGSSAKQADWFFEGYGSVEVDALALAYYRYEWVLQEISDCAERAFLMPELGAKTRQDVARAFQALFAPGDVVEAVYVCDSLFRSRFSADKDYNPGDDIR